MLRIEIMECAADSFVAAGFRRGPRTVVASELLGKVRWRLVVPNGTPAGFMVPPPDSWMPWVQVRR